MAAKTEVLQATHDLLASVATTDYAAYEALSDKTLTCFEPDTKGHLVEGCGARPAHRSAAARRLPSHPTATPHTSTTCSSGLAFHKYFFDLGRKAATSASAPPKQNTIASPHVRMLGDDAAVISYVRVIQSGGDLATCQETRVWQRGPDRKWKNVHFHRSSNL